MKYDQHLLESAYNKILFKEDTFSFEADSYKDPKNTSEKTENLEIENEIEREESDDSMQEIINELSNRIPSENILKNLNGLDSNEIEDLISILNEREEWALKDNLIRFLFVLKGYEF